MTKALLDDRVITGIAGPTFITTIEAVGEIAECLNTWERFEPAGTPVTSFDWVHDSFSPRQKRGLEDFESLPDSLLAAPFEELYKRARQMRVSVDAAPPRATISRAWNAYLELGSWLALGKGETADLLGIGRTTPNAWEKGREPQPARARSLYRTHAFVSTLVRRMGSEKTRLWLQSGEPSHLDRIRAGALDEVERAADHLIFGRANAVERISAWSDDESLPKPRQPTRDQPAPLRRVPRKPPKRAS